MSATPATRLTLSTVAATLLRQVKERRLSKDATALLIYIERSHGTRVAP
jgi:hypothetical protein